MLPLMRAVREDRPLMGLFYLPFTITMRQRGNKHLNFSNVLTRILMTNHIVLPCLNLNLPCTYLSAVKSEQGIVCITTVSAVFYSILCLLCRGCGHSQTFHGVAMCKPHGFVLFFHAYK